MAFAFEKLNVYRKAIDFGTVVARGSFYETIALLQILLKKRWIESDAYKNIYKDAEEIAKMLSGLINTLNAHD